MAMFSVPAPNHNLNIFSTTSFQNMQSGPSPAGFSAENPVLIDDLMMYSDYGEGKRLGDDGKDKGKNNGQQKRKSISTRGSSRQKGGQESGAESMTNEIKKRGRPRVDCPDKTAAERRRTQIRLAQRAYRMRKETAISSLSQRVTELETNMQEMREAILALNNEAMRSGALSLYPRLAQLLKTTAKRVISLAPEASDGNKSPGNISEPNEIEPQPATMTEEASHVALDSTPETQVSGESSQNIPDKMFYLNHEPVPSKSENDFIYMNALPPSTGQLYGPTGSNAISTINIPSHLARKFRLTFYLTLRNLLPNSFTTLLQRSAREPLEFLEKPHYCLGGAGMHYPRRDGLGNDVFPPNMQSLDRLFGALISRLGETEKFKNVEEFIEKMGLGGTWFDCHDVEGYLKTKGIHLGNLSTFIEIPSSVVTSPREPLTANNYTNHPRSQPNSHGTTSPAEGSYSPLKPSHDYLCHNGSLSHMHFLGLDSQLLLPRSVDETIRTNAATRRPQTMVMDVEKFTTRRAPGFRKRDIHAAIIASICTPDS
ncbi:conserved hypothetical protein [Microsporum canis CBS 113480]|uniref:BZIP domain-containing protein n=1 Tax=Arthroderma otae (strain ATCC MYA-4605 / CBS 113480) TaxID=554155 RepID=C5FTT3_ARTOC|nr:conserved hypothetical protein [Microsporum canis CBS 113480]EEQ33286.1 conserved hypothetical protein [Microsporum canis CBS 113480]